MLVLPQLNNAAPQPLTAQLPLEMVRDKNLTEDALTLLSSKLPVVIDNADEVALKVVADVKLFINTPLPTVNTPPLLLKLIFAFTTRLSVMVSALVEFWVKVKLPPSCLNAPNMLRSYPVVTKVGLLVTPFQTKFLQNGAWLTVTVCPAAVNELASNTTSFS